MFKNVILFLICLAVMIAVGLKFVQYRFQSSLARMTYQAIELQNASDGVFEGEATVGPVFAKVDVTVENHQITDIKIIDHRNGRGKPAEAMLQDMLAKNTYVVDAVSGATYSSVAIKSAVNQALERSIE